MPTELGVYKPEHWTDDALFRIEVREAYGELLSQGWTDALRELHPGERIYTFWDYFRNAYGRDAGLRLDHFLLSPSVAERLSKPKSTSTPWLGKYQRSRARLDRARRWTGETGEEEMTSTDPGTTLRWDGNRF